MNHNQYPHQGQRHGQGQGHGYQQGGYPHGGQVNPHMNQQQYNQQQRPMHGAPSGHHNSSPQPKPQTPVWKPNAYEVKQLDTWFYHIDEERVGVIKGAQAVTFLKKSNLHREILRKIWALVDTQNRGFIDKVQFYVIMRLVSICHNIPDMADLSMDTYYRTVYADFKLPPMIESEGPTATASTATTPISPTPQSTVPRQPPTHQPPTHHQPNHPPTQHQHQPNHAHPPHGHPSHGHPQTSSPGLGPGPGHGPAPTTPLPPAQAYAMSQEEYGKYTGLFKTYDKDANGFLTGAQSFPIFVKSGVDQQLLRAIWELADHDRDHRINATEFAIAFHLILCVSKKRLPVPPCLPAPLLAVITQHSPAPSTQQHMQFHQHEHGPSPHGSIASLQGDFDEEFDDFQGPATSTAPPMPDMTLLPQTTMNMSSNMSSGSLSSLPLSSNMSCGSLNDMGSMGNIASQGPNFGQSVNDDDEFDDFQDATFETNVVSTKDTALTTDDEMLDFQQAPAEEVILTNMSLRPPSPVTPKRESKSISDILSSVSDDPLNLKASKLYADPAQLAASEEKRKQKDTAKTPAPVVTSTLPPSSDRMSAFDDLAEMDLQASNEEWDDFADETTAPPSSTTDIPVVDDNDEFGDFGEATATVHGATTTIGTNNDTSESDVVQPAAGTFTINSVHTNDSIPASSTDTFNDAFGEMNNDAIADDFGNFNSGDNKIEEDKFGEFPSQPTATVDTTDEFGDFGDGDTKVDDFGDFNAGDTKTDDFGDFNVGDTKVDDFGDFEAGETKADDFGDFGAGDTKTDDFGDFNAGNTKADDFGDFGSGDTKADDFGDFGAGDTKADDFGDFGAGDTKADNFGDFGSGDTKTDEFGDFGDTKIEDFGDLHVGTDVTPVELKVDHFGEFPGADTSTLGVSGSENVTGDFTPANTGGSDDFGDFNETDNGSSDSIGDFPSATISTADTIENVDNEDKGSDEFGDFGDSVTIDKEEEFGNFDTTLSDCKPENTVADKTVNETLDNGPDSNMKNATLDFSLDDMDDPFADIGERITAPSLEFSLLDMDMPVTPVSASQETFDLNSLLSSQSMTPTPSIVSLLTAPTTSTTENTDDSLLLLDFPALPTTSNFSTLPDPVNRNLNFDELEHLATVLAELNCHVEAYGALQQAQSVKRIRELSVQKMEAVENDDLELAIQLRDAINHEREEGVTATRSDEKAWLNTAAAGIENIKSGGTVTEAVSIDKLVTAVGKLDSNCGKQAKMKYLALRPNPDDVGQKDFLKFCVNSQRSLQLAIAVRSTHKLYVKYWQLVLSRVSVLLGDGIKSLEQFKEMPAGMQQTVMEDASADGGKFNTFVRGILQIAEVGSWVAVSCLEAMVETASATKTLSMCEVVVRLASGLRKMPNVVLPVVSMEDITARSDRQLSREGVTFCNITLRPIVLSSSAPVANSKKCPSLSGTSVVYKSVPYLQGAVSLWVNQIKGDGPPSNRASPFV